MILDMFQMGIADFYFNAQPSKRLSGNKSIPPAWADKDEKKLWEKGKRYAKRQLYRASKKR